MSRARCAAEVAALSAALDMAESRRFAAPSAAVEAHAGVEAGGCAVPSVAEGRVDEGKNRDSLGFLSVTVPATTDDTFLWSVMQRWTGCSR